MPIQALKNRTEVKKIKFHHRVKRFYYKNIFRKIYTVAIIGLIGANVFSMIKYASFADESLVNETTTESQEEVVVTMGPVDGDISSDDESEALDDSYVEPQDDEGDEEYLEIDMVVDSYVEFQDDERNVELSEIETVTDSQLAEQTLSDSQNDEGKGEKLILDEENTDLYDETGSGEEEISQHLVASFENEAMGKDDLNGSYTTMDLPIIDSEGQINTNSLELVNIEYLNPDIEERSVASIDNPQLANREYENITINRPGSLTDDDGPKRFIIMDRNLGATAVYNLNYNHPNTESFGYHYQWGNNYGFPMGCFTNGCRDDVTESSVSVSTNGAIYDESYDNKGYYGEYFIRDPNYGSTYWANRMQPDGLWGGALDSSSNNWGLDTIIETEKYRQGPCPDGWHVPSLGEWKKMMEYRCINDSKCTSSSILVDTRGTKVYFNSETLDNYFMQKYLLPKAGQRTRYQAHMGNPGEHGQYWTSTPGAQLILSVVRENNGSIEGRPTYSNNGQSVRCFKNYYVPPTIYNVTFDSNGGITQTGSIPVESGTTINLSGYTATRSGYDFIGWSTTSGAHIAISTNYNNYPVTSDITLYAIFSKTLTANFVLTDENAATLSSNTSSCMIYNSESSCPISAPNIKAKPGYTVDGWSTTEGETIANATSFTAGNTYYAVTHNDTEITITFDANGNQVNGEISKTCYKYNGSDRCSIISPNIQEVNGFRVIGWSVNNNKHSSDWTPNTPKDVTGDVTYYAQTKKDGYRVNVTYTKGNGVNNIGDSSNGCNVADIYNGKEYQSCEVTMPSITCNSGYGSSQWSNGKSGGSKINVLKNISYQATCLVSKDIRYTVEHYQQNIKDNNYTLFETDTKVGTTNEKTNAKANNYEGFTSKSFSQKTIQGGGDTVVAIYYDRKEYEVTFYDEDGKTVLQSMKKYRYGTKVSDMQVPTATKSASGSNTYTFKGWNPQLGNVKGNVKYIAQYQTIKSSNNDEDILLKDAHNAADDEPNVKEKNIKLNIEEYNPTYSLEENTAYQFARENGITTKSPIQKAKMNEPLTRIEMAKMLSYYAINVLGQTPKEGTGVTNFKDVSLKLDEQYDYGVSLSYQLGIMGQNMQSNKFRPKDEVTRAEFTTALSRMLYNMKDGTGKTKYYEPHMSKLYKEGIITKRDPKIKEKRGYVMLMLMRTVK